MDLPSMITQSDHVKKKGRDAWREKDMEECVSAEGGKIFSHWASTKKAM